MAEVVGSALLTVVFEKLASAVIAKVCRSEEVRSELKKWNLSLRQIRNLLKDASQKEITDEGVKDWLTRLQHLAYDIDDILDSLATDHAMHPELTEEPAAGGITNKVKKLIIPTCFTACASSSSATTEMDGKLKDISIELQKLYKERKELGLKGKDGRSLDQSRKNQGPIPPEDIVGREGEKEILVQQLLADREQCDRHNFRVVPIVGMGGVGKTTLARLLYNDEQVKDRFELKAWVCVSDEFDSLKIGNRIFESITGEKEKFDNIGRLQEDLSCLLSKKQFLLVLDDVWTEKIEDWDTLMPAFRAVAAGSKIIITTRKTTLVQHLKYGNPYGNPFHLNKLSDDDSLSLFAHYANNFDSNPKFRPLGEAIVKKCNGLPLALKALARLLSTKTNEDEWKEVLESEIWGLKDEDGVLPALRLSYLELSPCLKQLFAYTCLFPKDYVFEKEDLIWLWMAEGFLPKSNNGESIEMERLGEKSFDELLSRSFFEYVDNDKSLFVMHDLMNDLATSVAGEFFVRLDIDTRNEVEEQTSKRYRHISFLRENFMAYKKFKEIERATSLRTFLAMPVVVRNSWERFYLSSKILVDLIPQLPLLRVLCLSRLEIDEVPDSVGKLKHLRYLNLSQTRIKNLPDNVCDLYNLQILIVFGCNNLSKLPNNFSKLKKLRHLDIRDTPLLNNMPLGIGELKSLRTLSKIVFKGENEFGISRLKNLKNLRQSLSIHGLEKLQNGDEAREANLSQMRLKELKVEWSDVCDGSAKKTLAKEVLNVLTPHSGNLRKLEIFSYGGIEFPEWVGASCFRQLTDISIKKCGNCMFLPPLGQVPSLKKLSIESMDDVKEVGSELVGNGLPAFPSLEILRFYDMPGWEVWSVNGVGVGVFPCLKEFHIRNCPNMARWEVWSANANVGVFPCLEELSIDNCPKLVKVSLEALPSLRVLNVYKCSEGALKSLVGVASSVTKLEIGNISGISEEFTCKVSLPLLRVLRMYNCGEGVLKSLVGVASSVTELSIDGIWGLGDEVWGRVVQYLGALEKLEIRHCNEIRNLWESKEEEACKEVLVNLKKLEIYSCENLVRIRGEGGGEKEEEKGSNLPTSLRMLQIFRCKNLKHVSCLDNIETLFIGWCENLEHVSFPANSIQDLILRGCSSVTSVSFPTEGGGGGCQKLKSLSIGKYNSEVLEKELEKQVLKNNTHIPLQVLDIHGWENLKSIMELNCFIQQLTRLVIIDCGRIESFPNLQNLTSLKHLTIMNCPRMDGPPPLPVRRSGSGGGVSVGVWPLKLESLFIGRLKRPISEWGPLPTSSSLVHLLGGFGSSSSSEEDVKSFPTSSLLPPSLSSSLTELRLEGFKKMERISSSEGLQHLTSLQHLSIYHCPRLKDLPETLLPSLLSLKIIRCGDEELKEKMMSRRRGSYSTLLSHIPKVYIN